MYIIATIGPKSSREEIIDKVINGGVDGIRLNFSHGRYHTIESTIDYLRRSGKGVFIMADLQGNKVRVSRELKEFFYAEENKIIYFCSEEDYKELTNVWKLEEKLVPLNIGRQSLIKGSFKKIFMKDGTMEFQILSRTKKLIKTKVKTGGMIRAEKGCNLPGIDRKNWGLSLKDKEDIDYALSKKVEIICYSYCCYKEECKEFKEYIEGKFKRGTIDFMPKLWGKIETKEGVDNLKEILEYLDGVVLGRGDLVPETNLFHIPVLQNLVANALRNSPKELIIATHVFDSMKIDIKPTVNELNDIYYLLTQGVDGFLLTSETTIGNNHQVVVKTLKNVVEFYLDIINKRKKNKNH